MSAALAQLELDPVLSEGFSGVLPGAEGEPENVRLHSIALIQALRVRIRQCRLQTQAGVV